MQTQVIHVYNEDFSVAQVSVSTSGCRLFSLQTGRLTQRQSEQQTDMPLASSLEDMSRLVQAGGNQLSPPSPFAPFFTSADEHALMSNEGFSERQTERLTDRCKD